MNSTTAAMGPESRLLLVDGHSLAYRAFYALPVENFSAPDGQPTNAIQGFVSMLLQVVEAENPTHLAVAFDVSRDTFRKAEFPEYKANRAKSPEEFRSQVPIIREVLDAFGIVNIAIEGFEADDVIATLATAASGQQAQTFILTGDRDSLQLVNEQITVLYPTKGVRELARMTPAAVKEKYNVFPNQYADFAALRGDASDNLPSIPGVGEKTAASWLNTYENLDGILANASEIKGKVGQSLRDNASQVLLNRRLTQLVHDVPIEADVNDLHRHLGNPAAIDKVFGRLGFRSLHKRAYAAFVSSDTGVPVEKNEVVTITRVAVGWTPGKLSETFATFDPKYPVGVYAQVNGLADLKSIAFAWQENHLNIEISQLKKADKEAMFSVFANPKLFIVGHDLKPFVRCLVKEGAGSDAIKGDTQLIEYLRNPGQRGLDLEASYERNLQKELPKLEVVQSLFDETAADLSQHANAVLDLWNHQTAYLEASFMKLHDEIEIPTLKLLARMEFTGIGLDKEVLKKLETQFSKVATKAEKLAQEEAGKEFNLGSPKQLQEVLFVDRNLPKTKKIKTGYTTDAEALGWLFENTKDKVVEQILIWREVTKLKQTVSGLLPLIDENGRVHTTFAQTVAATGRLSSVDPNLQNIPVRTDEGKMIRAAFICGKEYESLLTADYSQIEMRIMAHLSKDEGLIAAFNSGEDLHTTVGSQVFGVAPQDVTADMRRKIKAMSYGLAYGLGSFGLSQQLGIETREASALMDKYFERFQGVRDYLKQVVIEATQTGYTETMFGRKRFLPDLQSTNYQARQAAERMALNAPIQGSAADLIKVAMLNVQAGIEAAGLKSRLLLQVHDELVLEVAPGEKAEISKIVKSGMESAVTMSVPLEVSMGFGENWDVAAH
ncbi:MAG: polymerase [Actinomycetota bacterium]